MSDKDIYKVPASGSAKSSSAVTFDVGMKNRGVDFGKTFLSYIDEEAMSSAQLAQHSKHIADLKVNDLDKQYRIITLLALYTGSEEDFARLQTGLKVHSDYVIDRPTFYKQLLDYTNESDDTVLYNPFVGYVANQAKSLEKSTKKMQGPTVAEYLLKMQEYRAKVDANLDDRDQRFTRKEARERGFVIPKGMLPVAGKGKNALFDTLVAVPRSYMKTGVLEPIFKTRWDSPMLRSRKTKHPLFSQEAQDFPDFDKALAELGDVFGYDIEINEDKTFTRESKYNVLFYDEDVDAHFYQTEDPAKRDKLIMRRWRRHFSNSNKNLVPTPEPEFKNADINRVKINNYELFAETVKALIIGPYHKDISPKKDYKARIKDIAVTINANGGRRGRYRAKIYYPYIIDVAAMIATRNAMYAFDFDKGKSFGEFSKSINLSLDQGLEFQYGNKLAGFYEPKARWLIPVIQELANEMTYDFYRKKGVTPQQIAEGMKRVNLKPGLVRNVSAQDATDDDYSMVLYDSIERIGDFDLTQDSVKNQTNGISATINNESKTEKQLNDERFKLFEEFAQAQKEGISIEEYAKIKREQTDIKEQKIAEINEISEKRQEIIDEVTEQKDEPELAENVTFEEIVINIDDKDEIDQVIAGEKDPSDVSQEYVNKSETQGKVYTETVAASMEEDPICYIDEKGRASYSRNELMSLNEAEILTQSINLETNNAKVDATNKTVISKREGLPANIAQKIRTSMYKKFNSNFQKMKMSIEAKLDKKLQSIEGKRITKATRSKLDEMHLQLDFYEDLIFSNIESIPELAKINSFKSKKGLSVIELNARIKSDDPTTSKIASIQKEMYNIINETIVGVTEMMQKDPKACSGKSITQLISTYKKQEMIDDKTYMKQVIQEVISKNITSEQTTTKSTEKTGEMSNVR